MTQETPQNAPSAPEGFPTLLIKNIPQWTLSICATLFAVVISFKLLGVDLGAPMQTVTDAYAKAIAAQADGMLKFDEATKRFEIIMAEQRKSIDDLNSRVVEALTKQTETNTQLTVAIQGIHDSIVALETRVVALEKNSHPGTKAHQ